MLAFIFLCSYARNDVYSIDDKSAVLLDTSLTFVIVAPKEKRQGRSIERPCIRLGPQKAVIGNKIGKYIKSITGLISIEVGKGYITTRAIGATLAPNAGIPDEVIIPQVNWSGYEMFDRYYRLSRDPSINIT
ncbi:hypothetical protein AYI68_g2683 [Smittium mucronatum]|uniref:Uncharacterized protein n=1 Tax=Smittium mucronatum TaxID=133383 RepID=A0A1R0H224_9FUNG|nr:hypothetical protein AYI68_g2683 [Smittium mucronatum]